MVWQGNITVQSCHNLLRRACDSEASMRSISVAGTVTVSRVSSSITSFRLINCQPATQTKLEKLPSNEDRLTILAKKSTPYLITERRVLELIPVLGCQPAVDMSHKPGGKLPLLSARPAVTIATLERAATNFAAW